MKEILESFKDKNPRYTEQHRGLIDYYATIQSSSDEVKTRTGKFFSTVYEFYLYAAFLGMRTNNRVPLPDNGKTLTFMPIKEWKPQKWTASDLVNFLFMALLEKTDTDLYELEKISEDEVKQKITDLQTLLEEYANGGFDRIQAKIDEDKYYFINSDYAFVDYLEEL